MNHPHTVKEISDFQYTNQEMVVLGPKILKHQEDRKGTHGDAKSPQGRTFDLRRIKAVIPNFHFANRIEGHPLEPVYKGLLAGMPIESKQLSSKLIKKGRVELANQVYSVSAIKHPNIVDLFGCHTGNNQSLLVYECIENKSVAKVLFGPQDLKRRLDWKTRFNICLGIAKGLAFLHEQSKYKIIHRDIQLSNVVLDKHLSPKISNFGLAKHFNGDGEHLRVLAEGALGYMAPEYALGGIVTRKIDVYSFGVIMFELLSGKTSIEFVPSNESILCLDLAYFLQQGGNFLDLIDPDLKMNDISKEEAASMMNLAMWCINVSPACRPNMSEVVQVLQGKTLMKTHPSPPKNNKDMAMPILNITQKSDVIQNGGGLVDEKMKAPQTELDELEFNYGYAAVAAPQAKEQPSLNNAASSSTSDFVDGATSTISEEETQLEYFEPCFEEEKLHVECTDDELAAECEKWKDLVVGFLLGESDHKAPFNVNKVMIEKLLGVLEGDVSVFSMKSGYFLLQFTCVEDKVRALESSGLRHVGKQTLVLRKWDWRLKFDKLDKIKRLPLWVKIYNLPLYLWCPSFLGKVGSGLGVPLNFDRKTKGKENLDFVRLFVEFDACKPLQDLLKIIVKGNEYCLDLEYDWKPSRCAICCSFGHRESKCQLND